MIKESAATAASYTASVSVVTFCGFSLNEWGVIAGIVGMIATYLTNLYYKRKADARFERAEKAGRLTEIQGND